MLVCKLTEDWELHTDHEGLPFLTHPDYSGRVAFQTALSETEDHEEWLDIVKRRRDRYRESLGENHKKYKAADQFIWWWDRIGKVGGSSEDDPVVLSRRASNPSRNDAKLVREAGGRLERGKPSPSMLKRGG
jgi:hypothetical protein